MIENHVVNLELSKKLKELGINKKSLFYWIYEEKNEKWDIWFTDVHPDEDNPDNYISAYLATEIFEELPGNLYINEETVLGSHTAEYTLIRERIKGVISPYLNGVYYRNWDYIILGKFHNKEENECNALAKMIIYLIEKKLYLM